MPLSLSLPMPREHLKLLLLVTVAEVMRDGASWWMESEDLRQQASCEIGVCRCYYASLRAMSYCRYMQLFTSSYASM